MNLSILPLFMISGWPRRIARPRMVIEPRRPACSEARWEAIAASDVCRRWWRHMRDVMPAEADDRPVSRPLREVFHLPHE